MKNYYWPVLAVAVALQASSTLGQNAKPIPHKSTVSAKNAPPSQILHYKSVDNIVYRTRDGITIQSIATLGVPDSGVAIVTLESAHDVGRGTIDRIDESLTLVKGETKKIPLSSPGNKQRILPPSCQILLTLDSSGNLAIGPAPALPPSGMLAPGCGFSAVVELRFHALLLLTQ